MNEELDMMAERGVWTLETPPVGKKLLPNRWVYVVKRDEKGTIQRFKARLVAGGHQQKFGFDYDEVFSPVINFTLIRLCFCVLVGQCGWKHVQADVTGAYLYGPLNHDIWMKMPVGFDAMDGRACRLRKALYGLHQSGREWYFHLHKTLIKLHFKPVQGTNCAYQRGQCILLVYVDDMAIIGINSAVISAVIQDLSFVFELKIIGPVQKLLGVHFVYEKNSIGIQQSSYILTIKEKFPQIIQCHSSLPIVLAGRDTPAEKNVCIDVPYRQVIGMIMFIANRTRPDVLFAVTYLAQYSSSPRMQHWDQVCRLVNYLEATADRVLCLYRPCATRRHQLDVFADASWAISTVDRKSFSGYLVRCDLGIVSWKSQKQKCVSLSSMEAEFVALSSAAKETIWLQRIVESSLLKDYLTFKPTLFCDNQAARQYTSSYIENDRTKHIDVQYQFVRDCYNEDMFNLQSVSSEANQADFLTKPLNNHSKKIVFDELFL